MSNSKSMMGDTERSSVNSEESSFPFEQEPHAKFRSVIEQWESRVEEAPMQERMRMSRKDARKKAKESFKGLGRAARKMLLRQPINIYQKPVDTSSLTSHEESRYIKSPAEVQLIRNSIGSNFVFSGLSESDMEPLVSAFEKCNFKNKETIIRQGEPGDFFYVINEGKVDFIVNGRRVGSADRGKSFGELALLYTCPRAASVEASSDTTLFRVGQDTFRRILQARSQASLSDKMELLEGLDLCQGISKGDLYRLSAVMTPYLFKAGQTLVRKGGSGKVFFIIKEGKVCCKDISVGASTYVDQELGPGDYFGERALLTREPRAANVIALTSGMAFTIDKKTFKSVFGSMAKLVMRAQDSRRLLGLPLLQSANLDNQQVTVMASLIKDISFQKGNYINKKGKPALATMYFVREGEVKVGNQKFRAGEYFGERILESAIKSEEDIGMSPVDVFCTESCILGALSIQQLKDAFGLECLKKDVQTFTDFESGQLGSSDFLQPTFTLSDLKRISILGEGSFGQVWLVSAENDSSEKAYALKIMSKKHLVEEGQATATIQERNILRRLKHPFIIKLVSSFQNESFVFFLMDFARGGELFSLMHDDQNNDHLSEQYVSFYALCIQDALSYMRIVYRDLKPENIMLDQSGYPIIIDFGFAKYVEDKTYTLCGTPAYLAPEIITCLGHTLSVDNWALGVLICEMITGDNPFYFHGIDQMTLFQSIVSGEPDINWPLSPQANDLVTRLLEKDPTLRLGSLERGEREIAEHEFFAGLSLADLRLRKLEAPWVPDLDGLFDVGYFDDWSRIGDKLENSQEFSPKGENLFKDF